MGIRRKSECLISCAEPFAAEEVMRLPGSRALSARRPSKPPHASVVFITAAARKAAVTHVCAPHMLGLCFAVRVDVFFFFANLAAKNPAGALTTNHLDANKREIWRDLS
ncbi:hypothetical protein F442_18387 [Phytophthora nicotianae P10297]|uniref:Uncharacterized protein n=1 Tax=Phytophthora nicotianae P10297 TaxID=1317064 RepID=W2YD77_PHYNI|nr:hypothetical protein F442_18387 [Phytophthora nicotianae P10297]